MQVQYPTRFHCLQICFPLPYCLVCVCGDAGLHAGVAALPLHHLTRIPCDSRSYHSCAAQKQKRNRDCASQAL